MERNDLLKNFKNKLSFVKKKNYDYLDIWNYLMLHYGWIPYDEFLSLDSGILDKLVEKLNKRNEEIIKKRRKNK